MNSISPSLRAIGGSRQVEREVVLVCGEFTVCLTLSVLYAPGRITLVNSEIITMSDDSEPEKGSPSYIAELSLENVRCFGPEQALDLCLPGSDGVSQWTVILGDNGTGKTTLLQSLFLMEPVEPEPRPGVIVGRHPRVQHGYFGAFSSVWKRFARGRREQSNEPSPGVKLRIKYGLPAFVRNDDCVVAEWRVRFSDQRMESNPSYSESFQAPVMLGYGAGRLIGNGKDDEESGSAPPWSTLFRDHAYLPDPEEWLKQVDYAASKAADSETTPRAGEKRDRIVELLIDVMPDVEDIEFDVLDEPTPRPIVKFKTPYGWVQMKDLSLGYRTMISWVVDMTRRLFEKYPDSDDPLAEPAIVLVDEFDLHLHPRWQRRLVGHLTERFPNTQFIVTAHSPLIVQAASDANIVVLRREGDHAVIDNDVEAIKGWTIDQILSSELYGLESVRPPEYDDLLRERKEILQKPTLTEEDEERLEEIKKEIASLPGGETAWDVDAMDTIHRFAKTLEGLDELNQDDERRDGGDEEDQ